MPVTSALTTVSGTNLFSSLTTITTLDTANNYAEFDGCDIY